MNFKTALECAILSQEIYRDFSDLKFQEWPEASPDFIQEDSTDTQLAILEDPSQKLAVITFRGSDGKQDWNTNLQFAQAEHEWSRQEKRAYRQQVKAVVETVAEEKELVYPRAYGNPSRPVKIHSGFITAYLSVRDAIHNHIEKSNATLYRFTGHSLGGALAALCAVDVQYNYGQEVTVEAYTFGAPRIGNAAFAESYNARVPNTWRVVHGWDAVVGVPVIWQGYRHINTEIKLNRPFTLRIISSRFQDHRISDYIRVLEQASR